jgi:hypothetical protein
LELECDDPPVKKPAVTMNAEAREFRPKRKAAKEAEKLFKNIAEFELEKLNIELIILRRCSCSYLISPNQIGGECWKVRTF